MEKKMEHGMATCIFLEVVRVLNVEACVITAYFVQSNYCINQACMLQASSWDLVSRPIITPKPLNPKP